MKPKLHRGYQYVSLQQGPRIKQKQVHRLVLETFVEPCPEGMECCHNNGIRTDNKLENLRWDTKSNNSIDSIKHGTHTGLCYKGEICPAAKLKEKDVRMIIYMHKTVLFLRREIAEIYNVTCSTIDLIINKKTWKHIWSDFKIKPI